MSECFVSLEREPDNPHDSNAILVVIKAEYSEDYVDKYPIGYVPKDVAYNLS